MPPLNPPPSFCPYCLASISEADAKLCPFDGTALLPWAQRGANWIGRVLGGRYSIRRFLGAGGCAEVFEATQVGGRRDVAVKILGGRLGATPGSAERFRREAELISLVAHPNIVAIQDYGTLDDGTPFMVMELLQGETLEERLEQEPLAPLTAFRLALQICEGLAAAHEREVVHRDVKPANLFLVPGSETEELQVKILDLGIAKLIGRSTTNDGLTKPGAVFGTPDYMSPEQAIGAEVGPAADIYSVACVLWEMLVGAPPFPGDSVVEVLAHHVHSTPVWPSEKAWARAVPEEAEGVLMRALSKSPGDRPSTILDLQAEISRIAGRCRVAAQRATVAPGPAETGGAPVVVVPPSAVHRAYCSTLPARGAPDCAEVVPGVYWLGRRHGGPLEGNPYLRVFRSNGRQAAVAIDPGGLRDLDAVIERIARLIGSLDALDYVFLNHQDPDVSANALPILRKSKAARLLCSEDTWRLVESYGIPRERFVATESFARGRLELTTGHHLQFVPSPFCHFRGAVMLYDPESGVLFSGDLFGGSSESADLQGSDESWPGVESFHQIYMPSSGALRRAIASIRALDPAPRVIAPQHGAIFTEDWVAWILERMEHLPVGLDLLSDTGVSRDGCAAAVSEILDAFALVAGESGVLQLLRHYAADGSSASPFVLDGPRDVVGFRIEPSAALATLIRDVLASIPAQSRGAMERLAHRASSRHGVGAHSVPRYSMRPPDCRVVVEELRIGRSGDGPRRR